MYMILQKGSNKYNNEVFDNKFGKDTYEEALEAAKKAIAHGASEAKIVKLVAVVERKVDVTVTTI